MTHRWRQNLEAFGFAISARRLARHPRQLVKGSTAVIFATPPVMARDCSARASDEDGERRRAMREGGEAQPVVAVLVFRPRARSKGAGAA
jgi:hypothetical protein